ncbi:putative reverse transcriptase domain-containing protein [Tanacetum coccineum]
MTQAAIRQLVTDSVAAALEAQAANMANIDNINRNSEPREIPTTRKGTNNHKRKFDDKRNTTTTSNNNNSNKRNNNNYQDNYNNRNRNNDYHQQQNIRQETVRTYAAKKYHRNLPLCTRCTLHHTEVFTVKCQTCNKVGHRTRNCRSKGPATRSNLQSVFITCHACGEKRHYKMEIMDREVKKLRQRRIPIVKVRWNSEFTWEREDQIHAKYPHLFSNNTPSFK